jgi:hypothetical protein
MELHLEAPLEGPQAVELHLVAVQEPVPALQEVELPLEGQLVEAQALGLQEEALAAELQVAALVAEPQAAVQVVEPQAAVQVVEPQAVVLGAEALEADPLEVEALDLEVPMTPLLLEISLLTGLLMPGVISQLAHLSGVRFKLSKNPSLTQALTVFQERHVHPTVKILRIISNGLHQWMVTTSVDFT